MEGEKVKLPDHGLEEGAPAGEIRSIELEGDGDMGLDVDGAERADGGRC
jgi:hypothetical protein